MDSWLKEYQAYVKDTESPSIYHTWVGLSCISAAVRKRVVFPLGRINVYPNLYVSLVGPPGTRKSQAIKYGKELLSHIDGLCLSSDATTPAAFITSMMKSKTEDNGVPTHCSMTVISSELGIFLGRKDDAEQTILSLTELWDCPEYNWTKTFKSGPSDIIPNPWLSLLAATTPSSIAENLPRSAIGGGLIARMMFVYASKRGKKIPIPTINAEEIENKQHLIRGLKRIASLSGNLKFSKDGHDFWNEWYTGYEEDDPSRLCKEPEFYDWYERKQIHVLKVASILSMSESSEMEVSESHLIEALSLIEKMEGNMGHVFIKKNEIKLNAEVEFLKNIISDSKRIAEHELRAEFANEFDLKRYYSAIKVLLNIKVIKKGWEPIKDGEPTPRTYFEWL